MISTSRISASIKSTQLSESNSTDATRSRRSFRRVAVLFIVFLISSLWHGITWNFIIWGMFHGIAVIYRRAYR